jgi:hypothetical protein
MAEERNGTFLDDLLQDSSTMVQYLELLDEDRAKVIHAMHEEWLSLLDTYRKLEYEWLNLSKVVPHVRQPTTKTKKTPKTKKEPKTKTKTKTKKAPKTEMFSEKEVVGLSSNKQK